MLVVQRLNADFYQRSQCTTTKELHLRLESMSSPDCFSCGHTVSRTLRIDPSIIESEISCRSCTFDDLRDRLDVIVRKFEPKLGIYLSIKTGLEVELRSVSLWKRMFLMRDKRKEHARVKEAIRWLHLSRWREERQEIRAVEKIWGMCSEADYLRLHVIPIDDFR